MITSVPITEFRKDLFKYADLVAYQGWEVEVEKDGRKIFKVSRVENTPQKRAERAIAALKKLGGAFPDFKTDNEFFRGKKEIEYMKRLGKW
jgi:hypothetical protein